MLLRARCGAVYAILMLQRFVALSYMSRHGASMLITCFAAAQFLRFTRDYAFMMMMIRHDDENGMMMRAPYGTFSDS